MWGIFGKPLKRAIWNTQVCMLNRRYGAELGLVWGVQNLLAALSCYSALLCPRTFLESYFQHISTAVQGGYQSNYSTHCRVEGCHFAHGFYTSNATNTPSMTHPNSHHVGGIGQQGLDAPSRALLAVGPKVETIWSLVLKSREQGVLSWRAPGVLICINYPNYPDISTASVTL